MSWEIFVQVWLFTIVGFVVGVVLTWLFGVLPLRRKLRRLAEQQERPAAGAQQAERAQTTGQQPGPEVRRRDTGAAAPRSAAAPAETAAGAAATSSGPAAPASAAAAPSAAAPEPAERQREDRVFAPRTGEPVPEESPEEQTIVLEAFDFGGPESRSQTRTLAEDEDDEPWQPEVRIDPNDRLSDQLAKRSPQPEPSLSPLRDDEPGMFEPSERAGETGETGPAAPGNATSGHAGSPHGRPQEAEPLHAEPWHTAPPQAQPPHAEPPYADPQRGGSQHGQPQPTDPQHTQPPQADPQHASTPTGQEQSFSYLRAPAQENQSHGFPGSFPGSDPDALPRRRPGAAGAAAAGDGSLATAGGTGAGGSLFDPSADLTAGQAPEPQQPEPQQPEPQQPEPQKPEPQAAMGPFGPGSALPRPDGSSPSPEFTVKARTSSMVFHTDRSPFFDRLLPQVWFRSVEEAKRAGFASWDRPHEE